MAKGLCIISYHGSPRLSQWSISVILQSWPRHCSFSNTEHTRSVFQLIHSVTELLWNIRWKSSPNGAHKWSFNHENIFVIKKCGYINHFHGQSQTPVLSLEHLIPMTHTGLLLSIHAAPSFPPAAPIPRGAGAPASCILSELEFG